MLKRKIMNDLLKWKEGSHDKVLVVKGLRQVGKTYIINQFCRENYKNVVYINFKEQKEIRSIFDGDLVVDSIIVSLSAALPGTRFVPHKTIIFFDEIQDCSRARTSLKTFVNDGRYDVIASGSLLGLRDYNKKLKQDVPVGYERFLTMMPLDFEEFLWAMGIDDSVIATVTNCFKEKKPVPQFIHNKMMEYYRQYLIVGGMPNVVNEFIKTHDINAVLDNQRDLLQGYKDDFGKHLNDEENEIVNSVLLSRIEAVFDSLPAQLSKENNKFQYSAIKKSARAREYSSAVQWLVDYGLVDRCFNLKTPQLPLEGNKDEDVFKLYMCDTGLFIAMLEEGTADDILKNRLYQYKGAIYENVIADSFLKNSRKLYYFHKDSGLEIDFVTRYQSKSTLIEVKAKNGDVKAAKTILKNQEIYHVDSLIKLGDYNVGYENNILTLPYYMAFLINER